jgi:hypothetical protein
MAFMKFVYRRALNVLADYGIARLLKLNPDQTISFIAFAEVVRGLDHVATELTDAQKQSVITKAKEVAKGAYDISGIYVAIFPVVKSMFMSFGIVNAIAVIAFSMVTTAAIQYSQKDRVIPIPVTSPYAPMPGQPTMWQ